MPKRSRQQARDPKQIVYLWGAGATQAEISYLGAGTLNLLMQDSDLGEGIATRILQRLPMKVQSSFLTEYGTDIEKLISLLAASTVSGYEKLAGQIRRFYFKDICENLAGAKILSGPKLAIGLLEMHNNVTFEKQEVLSGIITTNHDGLLQLAMQHVNGSVNIGIQFESNNLVSGASAVLLLQLHGSFTWTFGLPIKVTPLRKNSLYSPDTVWIPPAILKESKNYPFNKLAGLAYEMLSKRCDVLRIVGASLTQNDWNILSMIFNAQRHRELSRGQPFRVELIMPQQSGEEISRECSYLRNLTPIGQLTDGDFAEYKEQDVINPDMKNPLFYWLKQKLQFHSRQGHLGTIGLTSVMSQIAGETL